MEFLVTKCDKTTCTVAFAAYTVTFMKVGNSVRMAGKTKEGGQGRFSIPDSDYQHARKVAQRELNAAAPSTRKLSNASRGHELRNQVPD